MHQIRTLHHLAKKKLISIRLVCFFRPRPCHGFLEHISMEEKQMDKKEIDAELMKVIQLLDSILLQQKEAIILERHTTQGLSNFLKVVINTRTEHNSDYRP